jgi:hypothetical protein
MEAQFIIGNRNNLDRISLNRYEAVSAFNIQ